MVFTGILCLFPAALMDETETSPISFVFVGVLPVFINVGVLLLIFDGVLNVLTIKILFKPF